VSTGREEGGGIRRAIYAGPGAMNGAPVTHVLIWVNVAIFALEVLKQGSLSALVDVSNDVSRLFGANGPSLTFHAHHYESLLTSCFAHGSLLHVALNMYALRQVGPLVEPSAGGARFSVMYVLSGIVASLTSATWSEATGNPLLSVGASGAICGVMGAAVVVAVRVHGWRSSIAWDVGLWLGLTLIYGATSQHVDNAAHVGGMIAGCATALAWRRGVVETTSKRVRWVGASALLCLGCMGVTAWRDFHDPFAVEGPTDRSSDVTRALEDHDCVAARRALRAVEAVPPSDSELEGLRQAVDERCPRPPR